MVYDYFIGAGMRLKRGAIVPEKIVRSEAEWRKNQIRRAIFLNTAST
jgi:hypothetical protein